MKFQRKHKFTNWKTEIKIDSKYKGTRIMKPICKRMNKDG